MKHQAIFLLLAGLVCYIDLAAGALAAGQNPPVFKVFKKDGTTEIATGTTVYVDDEVQFECTQTQAGVKQTVVLNGDAELTSKDESAASTGTIAPKLPYTFKAADKGTLTLTCQNNDKASPAVKTAKSTPAITLTVADATTTPAPTTTTASGGSGGKSGAGSNNPAIALFLLSVAAMCF